MRKNIKITKQDFPNGIKKLHLSLFFGHQEYEAKIRLDQKGLRRKIALRTGTYTIKKTSVTRILMCSRKSEYNFSRKA